MVEPMSFDRIGNLGNSSTMKARLQEEVRLVEITQGTRVRYTEMVVFSAVAGNQLPNQLQKRVLPALFHLRCLAITLTFSTWTHTSDDSYIYQLSLVLATATVSFFVCLVCQFYEQQVPLFVVFRQGVGRMPEYTA